jgi:hypothetical protein
MNPPLCRQQGLITDQIPLAIELVAFDAEEAQAAARYPRHARLADPQTRRHGVARAQPEQPVQRGQNVLLDQGGSGSQRFIIGEREGPPAFVEFSQCLAAAHG